MSCHDEASRFVFLLSWFSNPGGRHWLCAEDFYPLVQDVVDTHPGLTFLKEASEFHSRYVHTVVARIFYCVNRSWSGRITAKELRKSQLLVTLRRLQEEEDINRITDFFSYEHFYVIYCKFWELDTDHDLLIDRRDLARHNDHEFFSFFNQHFVIIFSLDIVVICLKSSEYFYEEQLQRMEAIGIETLPFEDCLCQMLDMIHPRTPGKISLSDLKRNT
ncbi:hypothetical protein J437_LFUL007250 [Ladona fulva]|uniref:PP2A regulatory subunit B'' EF-hand domain-containing protein n=1 Tax=Ladona fulva TaxID=123851 RepID=A0A8K0JY88_LADFU|nr:hypothetical protein J437_LFUL007250 [Ladona fulva]